MSKECTHCNKVFRTQSLLKRHSVSHLPIKPYKCEICDKTFTQNSSLVRHHTVVHINDKKFECPYCGLKFKQKDNVKIHIQRLHSAKENDSEKYPCPHCTCIFNKLNSCNRHVAKLHTNSTNEKDDSIGNIIEHLKILQQNSSNIYINDVEMELQTLPEKILSDPFDDDNDDNDLIGLPKPQIYIEDESNLNNTTKCSSNKFQYKFQNNNFQCPNCEKKFKKRFDLSRHLRIHNNVKPFSCTTCSMSFTLKFTLMNHMKTHLEVKKNFQCPFCFKRFVSEIKCNKHTTIHLLAKSFKCGLCPKSFKLKQSLEAHEKIHKLKNLKKEEIRKYLVPPITITDEPQLKNFEYKYNCSKCSLKFRSLAHLRYHEAKHIGVKNFKCNICERCFLTKSSLTCHILFHSSIRDFKCEKCSAKFKTSTNLKRHLLVHANERRFMCAYCCKTFQRKSNCQLHLNTHIKDILIESEANQNQIEPEQTIKESFNSIVEDSTTNNLGYTCAKCKKNFKKSNDLERHTRIHNKEKPFKCEICNKSFTLKGTLKSHMNTHTENRNKISCTVCDKLYATQSALTLHLRIHTGELPFKCEYCSKAFRTAGHKIAHSKQHAVKNKNLLKT